MFTTHALFYKKPNKMKQRKILIDDLNDFLLKSNKKDINKINNGEKCILRIFIKYWKSFILKLSWKLSFILMASD